MKKAISHFFVAAVKPHSWAQVRRISIRSGLKTVLVLRARLEISEDAVEYKIAILGEVQMAESCSRIDERRYLIEKD